MAYSLSTHPPNLKIIGANEKVVSIVTGNGLKDVQNAIKAVGEPIKVEPSLKELLVKLEGVNRGSILDARSSNEK